MICFRLEPQKSKCDRTSGSISGRTSIRDNERNSDTHNLPSISQPDTLYTQIHLGW